MPAESIESRVSRLAQQLQEMEVRAAGERRKFQAEIAQLREQQSVDVLSRRVEWTISEISQKIKELPKGGSIYSPEFSAAGLPGLQLEFFPNGRESASIPGMCSVFFWCGEGMRVRYQLFVGGHYRAPDDDEFTQRMGHGHSNFCKLEHEIDKASDSVVVGVEVLDVARSFKVAPGLKIVRSSFANWVGRELSLVENQNLSRVEWKIPGVSKRLDISVRGAAFYSPLFSVAGVKDLQIEFYFKGNQATAKDGSCAFYLRAPEQSKLVVTMQVGNFKRGPIAANFDGPAGKGIPDFCEIANEIDRNTDSLLVAVEIKNVQEKKGVLQI